MTTARTSGLAAELAIIEAAHAARTVAEAVKAAETARDSVRIRTRGGK